MGMDIYLEGEVFKARRERAQRRFYDWVELRNEEKDGKKQAELQEHVWKWFDILHSPKSGYFRVSYNPYSLSYWLQYNVDEKAKGDWGIEPFYSAVKGKREPIIRSEKFRLELLKTVRNWYKKALLLKDKKSYLMVPDHKRSDPGKDRWVRKKVVLPPKVTNDYVEQLKDLVVFAKLAVKTKSPICVSY